MFVTKRVPALFKKGLLKLEKTEDGRRRVAEAQLVIEPFPAALAHELGEEIASHLFDANDEIRPELDAIDLRMRAGLQNVTVQQHEELEPVAILSPVSIKDLKVTRVEDEKQGTEWLALSFVLVFSLEDKEARNFVLDQFGRTLYWSFEGMQGDLLAKALEGAARLGENGGATLITPDGERVEFNADTAKQHRAKAADLRKQARAH